MEKLKEQNKGNVRKENNARIERKREKQSVNARNEIKNGKQVKLMVLMKSIFFIDVSKTNGIKYFTRTCFCSSLLKTKSIKTQ